ncbi:MAG: choice-of-anchor D domain-containing protein [Deltaproteobacteria bacterium]|nr:choice-of-anchor D domain-containing protein [Deltaproteobacteria bacterium]
MNKILIFWVVISLLGGVTACSSLLGLDEIQITDTATDTVSDGDMSTTVSTDSTADTDTNDVTDSSTATGSVIETGMPTDTTMGTDTDAPMNTDEGTDTGTDTAVNDTEACTSAARNCRSTDDNNCNGEPDNAEAACTECIPGDTEVCDTHGDLDGHGICVAGIMKCDYSPTGDSVSWLACEGAVGPLAYDCASSDDLNCDGLDDNLNPECLCEPGDTDDTCYGASWNGAPEPVGICHAGYRECLPAGTWETCTGYHSPEIRQCDSTADNDCNGTLDNEEDECTVCSLVSDINVSCDTGLYGICAAGTQSCQLSADKTTVGMSSCVQNVPLGSLDCSSSADNNCNDTPDNEESACVPSTVNIAGDNGFEDTVVGDDRHHVFTLSQSPALSTATISSVQISQSSSNFYIESNQCENVQLTGSDTCKVTVRFSPGSWGAKTATLEVEYTDGLESQIATTALSGSGLEAAVVTMVPPSYHFGTVYLHEEEIVIVVNIANNTMDTSAVIDAVDVNDSNISIEHSCIGNLAPGNDCDIVVTYAPTDVRETDTQLEVSYFDGANEVSSITRLKGSALDRCAGNIVFPDATLDNLIRWEVGKTDGEPLVSADLVGITSINFFMAGISDLRGMQCLTGLTTLNLSMNNNITDITPLAALSSLNELVLSNDYSIESLAPLAKLAGLNDLYLNSINHSDISLLASLTALRYLELGQNTITDISVLSSMSQLEYIGLSGNINLANISALVSNTALGDGDTINLESTAVCATSKSDVNELIARGATVYHDCN